MHPILFRKLSEIVEARHTVRLQRGYVKVLLSAALLTVAGLLAALVTPAVHEHFAWAALGLLGYLVLGLLFVHLVVRRERFDPIQLARDVEARDSDLSAVLLTAVEQVPGSEGLSYMQKCVVEDAALAAARHLWADELTARDRQRTSTWFAVALWMLVLGYGGFVWQHFTLRTGHEKELAGIKKEAPKKEQPPGADFQIEVTPGDAEVEVGTRLVVEAKFKTDVPPDAVLVMTDAKGVERQRVAMKPTVDSKVFGGLVSNIKEDGLYRVEFEHQKSKDFKISTFFHPELVKADARVTPPAYTGQPVKEIKNTLKVTAMEGSQVALQMKINKPVKDAELFADKDHIIPLKPSKDDPTVLETAWVPDQTRKYRLHLVDDHERANKNPPWFTITVINNALPKIEIAFPKRDAKVSRLQELALEAKLWDDVGILKAGAVIDVPEAVREVNLPLNKPEAGKKMEVKTLLNLEPEKVEPTQLVSYYFWAEDKGPKGEVRRTMSDMFFAEVREFEDIYREMEPPPSEEGGESSTGNKIDEVVKLQKDIVNASWRLARDQLGGKAMTALKPDVDTVMVSQAITEEKLDQLLEKVKDPKVATPLKGAKEQMKEAQKQLSAASEKGDSNALKEALKPEQRALRLLAQAQNNEHQVMRAQKSQQGQPQEQNQQELSELELKQKEKRYEEEKQASEGKTAEQEENLVVLNRLKELARRQEALAEKMKQLEQQLAEAKTEEEKEELANQLKRLQDEQDQLLRDLDDLKERMEKPENAANMAEAKKQLEETREKVNEASEKLKEEKLAQASSAASRAQKDLEQARDDFRQRTARRFSEEMKAMRDEARDLAQSQKKLEEALENQPSEDSQKSGDTSAALKERLDGAKMSRQIDEQKARAEKLMADMKRVSEQAEGSEPLLHKHLYDALRGAHTLGLEENLAEAGDQARVGDRNAAQDAERRASKGIEHLKEGVEKAAESVLGNESESLRMARNELDKLIEQARESAKGEDAGEPSKKGDAKQTAGNAGKDSKETGDKNTPRGLANATKPGEDGQPKDGEEGAGGQAGKEGEPKPGQGEVADAQNKKGSGQKPGEGKQPGEGQGKGEQPGERGQKGQGESKGEMAGGEGKGKEEQPSDKPGEGQEGKGNGQGRAKGEGKGQMASAQGQGEGQGEGQEPGGQRPGEQPTPGQQGQGQQGGGQGQQAVADNKGGQQESPGQRNGTGNGKGKAGNQQRSGGNQTSGGGGGEWFFDEAAEEPNNSAITGEAFGPWSDRLRNVGEMLPRPELRNQVEQVMDHARNLRRDYFRDADAPQVEHLQTRIVAPLVELRDKVTEEIAKSEGKNPLSPVDRDPVPELYRELVQKYYQELGAGK